LVKAAGSGGFAERGNGGLASGIGDPAGETRALTELFQDYGNFLGLRATGCRKWQAVRGKRLAKTADRH